MAIAAARLIQRTFRYGFRAADDHLAQERVAVLGGHDPDKPKVHEGWLVKRAVSNPGQNWKRRYVVLRDDRIEWHRKRPLKGGVPRGVLRVDACTTVDVPITAIDGKTLCLRIARVAEKTGDVLKNARGEKEELYVQGTSQQEMDEWAWWVREVVARFNARGPGYGDEAPADKGQRATIDAIAKKAAASGGVDHELKVLRANREAVNFSFLQSADPHYNYFRAQCEEAGFMCAERAGGRAGPATASQAERPMA